MTLYLAIDGGGGAHTRAGLYDAGRTLRLLEVNPRPGAYIGMSCARLHLLAWALDRLCGRAARPRAAYVGDERIRSGLRAFADLVAADDSMWPLALQSPLVEEVADARALSGCSS